MAEQKQNAGQSSGAAGGGAQSGKPARKKFAKNVLDAIAHVHASFNNTIITITDRQGNTLSWATSAAVAFAVRASRRRSLRRLPPNVRARRRKNIGVKNVEVRDGSGPGRESAVRALNGCGSRSPTLKT